MNRRLLRRLLFSVIAGLVVAVGVLALVRQSFPPKKENYSAIEPGLYMGGSVEAPPPGTKVVINLCEIEDPYTVDRNVWESIPDGEPAPSLDWLRKMVAVVDEEQQAGRQTYVHCFAGISRSGMVVAAYEMFKNHWTRDQALEFIRSKRPQVKPNPAFMQRLLEWEHEVLK